MASQHARKIYQCDLSVVRWILIIIEIDNERWNVMEKARNKQKIWNILNNLASIAGKSGNIFVPNSSEGVLDLLLWAKDQEAKVIQKKLVELGPLLPRPHKRFFEENGIDFSGLSIFQRQIPVADRGQDPIKGVTSDTKEGDEPNQKGKRKVIYRGQVKWID